MSTATINAALLRTWLAENGGGFHDKVQFAEVPSGFAIIAADDLPRDTTVVECPFNLAVTEELAKRCVVSVLGLSEVNVPTWTERVALAFYAYLPALNSPSYLVHHAYLRTLPSADKLRTPLHFTKLELELFQGTNLYGATLDRESEWRAEWEQCKGVFSKANPEWGRQYSWELYLTASTYLSSRAFPSSLLSRTPSLLSTPDTKPVLLPGIDSLNHGRKEPVSWVVTYPETSTELSNLPKISLVLHNPSAQNQELLNNYGAKPNSEFILGYGFALENNPDDTIVLKIGGKNGNKWEVGRSARGAEGLWNEILSSVQQSSSDTSSYEDQLDASGAFLDMLQTMIERLPAQKDHRKVEMRPEVALMLNSYVEGQRDILESLVGFAREKEQLAIEQARSEGVEIILED